jgi:nucleoside-diphosphate-sugar epimerase|tara:strand:+ start:565 stop:1605 length:1041 start_codon:yes stop_codon:yes gene_type:complete
MKKKIALITGGTGFIGTYLSKKLLLKGWKVNIIDLKKSRDPIINKKCNFYKSDLTRIKPNHKCFKKVSVIFHLAALPSISRKNKKKFLENNLGGTKNLILCAKKNKINKIIYTSSSTVYGVPKKFPLNEEDAGSTIGFYGKSKWLAEKELLNSISSKLNICILRPRVVIGPGRLGIFQVFFKRILQNKNIYLIGNGSNYFQFTNIDDFVEAIIKTINSKKSLIFNIGSNDRITTYKLINLLIKNAGSKSKIVKTPAFLIKFILAILEKIRLSPLTKEQYLIADKNFFLNTKKAKFILKWKSQFSTLNTLLDSYYWYKKNLNSKNNQTKQFGILTIFKNYQQSGFQS